MEGTEDRQEDIKESEEDKASRKENDKYECIAVMIQVGLEGKDMDRRGKTADMKENKKKKMKEKEAQRTQKILIDEAKMNIVCDRLARETTEAVLDGGEAPRGYTLGLPYAGSWAMVKKKETWITSK